MGTRQDKNRKDQSCSPIRCGILERGTDLTAISGRRLLVLLDEQNLSITAKKQGFRLQYDLLARRLRTVAETAELHIFTAVEPWYEAATRQQFKESRYLVHLKTIRDRRRHDSNIDNLFAFWAGMSALRAEPEILVLGSGDYGLSGELAKEIYEQRRNKAMSIMTLSLPGSTSQDLDAETNPNITANLEIGMDLLKPLANRKRTSAAVTVSSFRWFRFESFVNHIF